MGTISEKLTYLNGTKQKLKQAINNIGGEVTDETTFREYVNQLENAYDRLPKTEFEEGESVTLENTLKGKLDFDNGVVGIGQSSQATRQYIDVGTWEKGAIDGTTGLNGDNNSFVRTKEYIEVKPNVLYEMSRTIATDYMVFRFYDSNKSYLGSQATTGMVTTNRHEYNDRMTVGVTTMQLTINNTNVAYMRMVDASNDLSTIYTIYTDNTPSPSYPQTINSVTGNQDVVVSGKNLIDTTETNIHINASGDLLASDSQFIGISEYVDCQPNTTYSITFENDVSTALMFAGFKDKNGTFISRTSYSTSRTFTTPSNAYSVFFYVFLSGATLASGGYVQLEEGSTATTYEPYITPTTYQLSLGDIELNAIGNYKDELIYDVENDRVYKNEKIGKYTFTGEENIVYDVNNRFQINNIVDNLEGTGRQRIYSNRYKYLASGSADYGMFTFYNNIFHQVYIYDKDYTNASDFKTFLANNLTYFYYIKNAPTLTELTDETLHAQVKALYYSHSLNGTTIITSNGNLPMIIKVRALKGE